MKIYNKINDFLENDKNVLILSFSFLVVFSLPLLLMGGDVPYPIYDNLDSNVVWRKISIENADNPVPQMMNVRNKIESKRSIPLILAKIFPMATSLGVMRFLQMMIGFIGMFLLCRKYLTKDIGPLPAAIVALSFAILPFWSSGALSVAAQPLVVYSFLRIRDKENKIWDWLVIAIYPFISSFIVFGLFFYCFLFGIFCIDWYKKRKFNNFLFFALATLAVIQIVLTHKLFLSIFFSDVGFVSHRSEIPVGTHTFSLSRLKTLINGTNWGLSASNHFIIFWFSIFVFAAQFISSRELNKKIVFTLLTIVGIICFTHGYPVHLLKKTFVFFRMFTIDRFFTLLPLLMFILFAFSINAFYKIYINRIKIITLSILFTFFVQLGYSVTYDFTYRQLIWRYIFGQTYNIRVPNLIAPTFNEFYSPPLFKDLIYYIGKPIDSYRVGALGFPPAVLQFNGFYTIDGYYVNYDLKYKHIFGELIKEELSKNKSLESYFYNWGHRCYIFDDKVGKISYLDRYRSEITETESLDLNYDILKSLNCQYIISSVKILNPGDNLELESVFENEVWKIYLYKVI